MDELTSETADMTLQLDPVASLADPAFCMYHLQPDGSVLEITNWSGNNHTVIRWNKEEMAALADHIADQGSQPEDGTPWYCIGYSRRWNPFWENLKVNGPSYLIVHPNKHMDDNKLERDLQDPGYIYDLTHEQDLDFWEEDDWDG